MEYILGTTRATPIRHLVEHPDSDLHVPALCDVEVAAALRGAALANRISVGRAEHALEDYLDLPIERHGHTVLLHRALALRANFSAYDAVYVALAEHLAATLLTADDRLGRAVGRHTQVEVSGRSL